VTEVRPAESEEILAALGAHPGSLGPVGVVEIPIVADEALRGRRSMTTGANEDGWHLRHVDMDRDVSVGRWVDAREVRSGEPCVQCGEPIEIVRCIEVGHIFKLGTRYSEAMDARYLDENGDSNLIVMGSYGIGVGRAVAAITEYLADDKGLVWPMVVAPYEVGIVPVNLKDSASVDEAERIYQELRSSGIDVVIDDRDTRPGVKFADQELVGIPLRITVGPKGLAAGEVELFSRQTGEQESVPVGEVVDLVVGRVTAER
jgi:prolyl-tRNA synthetase